MENVIILHFYRASNNGPINVNQEFSSSILGYFFSGQNMEFKTKVLKTPNSGNK